MKAVLSIVLATLVASAHADAQGCTDCKEAFGYAKDHINDAAWDNQLFAVTKDLCGVIPVEESKCDAAVQQYWPQAKVLISAMTPDSFCTSIVKACTSEDRMPSMDVVEAALALPALTGMLTDDEWCTFCEGGIAEAQSHLHDQAWLARSKALALQGCGIISEYQPQCTQLINQYWSTIVVLAGTLNPTDVCTKAKLCSSAAPFSDTSKCTECTTDVQTLQSELKDGTATQDRLIKDAHAICALSPPTQKDCDTAVDTKAQAVIAQVLAAQPQALCAKAGLCPKEDMLTTAIKTVHAAYNNFGDLPNCKQCEQAFDAIKPKLDDQTFINQAIYLLKKACTIVNQMEEQCEQLIPQYEPVVIQFIKDTPSHQLCAYLKACSSEEAPALVTESACSECEHFLAQVKTDLKETSVDNRVKAMVKPVCGQIPNHEAECEKAFAHFWPIVLQQLPNLDVDKACQKAHACSLIEMPTPRVGEDYCQECEEYLADLKTDIKIPAKSDLAHQLLAEACTLLPSWSDRCSGYLKEYFDKGIARLEKENVHTACLAAHICTQ